MPLSCFRHYFVIILDDVEPERKFYKPQKTRSSSESIPQLGPVLAVRTLKILVGP
jgi:hypothetical protein